jgi:hypothetical protein
LAIQAIHGKYSDLADIMLAYVVELRNLDVRAPLINRCQSFPSDIHRVINADLLVLSEEDPDCEWVPDKWHYPKFSTGRYLYNAKVVNEAPLCIVFKELTRALDTIPELLV